MVKVKLGYLSEDLIRKVEMLPIGLYMDIDGKEKSGIIIGPFKNEDVVTYRFKFYDDNDRDCEMIVNQGDLRIDYEELLEVLEEYYPGY